MSRGPGRIQQAILGAVARHPGTSAAWLRWYVARKLGRTTTEGLDRSFYSAFQRALSRLCATPRPRLKRTDRPYASVEEIVKHYPHVTLSSEVRSARQQLLPELAAIETGAKFSSSQSEAHALRRHATPDSRLVAVRAWQSIERDILDALGKGAENYAAALVDLLVKGRQLFSHGGYEADHTFHDALSRLHDAPEGSSAKLICCNAGALADAALPQRDLTVAHLKAWLYKVVNFHRSERPALKLRTKEALYSRCPEKLRAMPGHTPPQERTNSLFSDSANNDPILWLGRHPTFSPLLDKLLLRDVLSEHAFLQACAIAT